MNRSSIHPAIFDGPVLGLMLTMATPNALAFLVQASVNMTEVWYVGQLGTTSLAAMGFVFPGLMLMQMLSGGAMGGSMASAVARSLGRGAEETAQQLLWHGIVIALLAGLLFLSIYHTFGKTLLVMLGAEGEALEQAMAYGSVVFTGGAAIWLTNIVSGMFRGMGEMRIPAAVMAGSGLVQVLLSGCLILGWFGAPELGLLGAAISITSIAVFSALIGLAILTTSMVPVRLSWAHFKLRTALFKDIFSVGALASITPFLTIASIMIVTGLISEYGEAMVAGYSIGARLEFLLVPMIFGFGSAMNTMVGMNIGAGNLQRAEHIAFVGGTCAASITGVVGIFLALFPEAWIGLFTDDPTTIASGARYLQISGWAFAFQGMGLALYFACQGAGRIFWPVVSNFVRFGLSTGGALMVVYVFDASVDWIFVCLALGMVCYGAITAGSIWLGGWRNSTATVKG